MRRCDCGRKRRSRRRRRRQGIAPITRDPHRRNTTDRGLQYESVTRQDRRRRLSRVLVVRCCWGRQYPLHRHPLPSMPMLWWTWTRPRWPVVIRRTHREVTIGVGLDRRHRRYRPKTVVDVRMHQMQIRESRPTVCVNSGNGVDARPQPVFVPIRSRSGSQGCVRILVTHRQTPRDRRDVFIVIPTSRRKRVCSDSRPFPTHSTTRTVKSILRRFEYKIPIIVSNEYEYGIID